MLSVCCDPVDCASHSIGTPTPSINDQPRLLTLTSLASSLAFKFVPPGLYRASRLKVREVGAGPYALPSVTSLSRLLRDDLREHAPRGAKVEIESLGLQGGTRLGNSEVRLGPGVVKTAQLLRWSFHGECLSGREGLQPHLLRGDEVERLRQVESLNVLRLGVALVV